MDENSHSAKSRLHRENPVSREEDETALRHFLAKEGLEKCEAIEDALRANQYDYGSMLLASVPDAQLRRDIAALLPEEILQPSLTTDEVIYTLRHLKKAAQEVVNSANEAFVALPPEMHDIIREEAAQHREDLNALARTLRKLTHLDRLDSIQQMLRIEKKNTAKFREPPVSAAEHSPALHALHTALRDTEILEQDKAPVIALLDTLIAEDSGAIGQPIIVNLREQVGVARHFGDVLTLVDMHWQHFSMDVSQIAEIFADSCGIKSQYRLYLEERDSKIQER